MTLFEPEPAAAGSVRVRMLVAYDGTGFSGFAANPGVTTVAGTLAAALERILRQPVRLTGAGRTDAGVHAWGQVVSFELPAGADPEGLDLEGLRRSLNAMAAPGIVVRSVAWADPGFDARFSALTRRYRYTVLNRAVPDPFLAATAWHVATPLDLADMRLACDPLHGEHDFSSFCRRPRVAARAEPVSLVRRIQRAHWEDLGEGVLHFEIEANAFCQQMVRSIVGLLVDIGVGKRRAGEVAGVIRDRDRRRAGPVAPPQGLCLWEVTYPGGLTWPD